MENYLVLDFSELKLNNWAVVLGRKNIISVQDSNSNFSLFKSVWKNKCFWFVYPKQWSKKLNIQDIPNILQQFPEFINYKVIIGLPNADSFDYATPDEYLHQVSMICPNIEVYVQLALAGDPQPVLYTNKNNLKVITSSPLNSYSLCPEGEMKLRPVVNYKALYDFKLSLNWFWMLNHLSLINRPLLEEMIDRCNKRNRIFILGRRITDGAGHSTSDSRKYFTSILQQIVSEDKYILHSKLNPHIDFAGYARNATSTALLLDYNSSYFNVIFESWAPHIDLTDTFTEKTADFCTFAAPSFLIMNPHLLSILESMGIRPLNSFFTGDTLEEKFRAFCKFYETSSEKEINFFHQQQLEIQKNNRDIFWNYAENSKDSIIESFFQESL